MCQNGETPAPTITPAFRGDHEGQASAARRPGLHVGGTGSRYPLPLPAEDGVDERGRVEGRQVIGPLAEPD
jgi:hypothetical protein